MPYPENKSAGLSVFGALTVLGALVAATFSFANLTGVTGKFTTAQATSTSAFAIQSLGGVAASGTVQGATGNFVNLNVSGFAALQGAAGASSTLQVPNGLTTLSSLTATGTVALQGATTLSSTLAVPAATSTLSGLSVTGTEIVAGNATVAGTVSSTGGIVLGGGGTLVKQHISVTTGSISPSTLAAGACTTTNALSAPGAVAGDAVDLGLPFLWSTSTASFKPYAGTGTVTVSICSTTSTASTVLTPAQSLRVDDWQY